jgi:hypothetical protein
MNESRGRETGPLPFAAEPERVAFETYVRNQIYTIAKTGKLRRRENSWVFTVAVNSDDKTAAPLVESPARR